MKFFLELLSGGVIGAVAALIARFMNIEMTTVQFGVLLGGIIFTTVITTEIVNAIMKKREEKKA